MIDEILKFNREFVANKGYEDYVTDKYPALRLAVVSCMDTRLTELLPAALGIRNGDAKIIKNAGGVIPDPFDSVIRSLIVAVYELGVEEVMVVAHSDCGACRMSGADIKARMLDRGITPETIETVERCGHDLDRWLEGFHDTEESVRRTVAAISGHPLIPRELVVRGFVIDSRTGLLTPVPGAGC